MDVHVKSLIVETLYIVELWNIDTSSDLRKMDVGEENDDHHPSKSMHTTELLITKTRT